MTCAQCIPQIRPDYAEGVLSGLRDLEQHRRRGSQRRLARLELYSASRSQPGSVAGELAVLDEALKTPTPELLESLAKFDALHAICRGRG